MTRRPYFCNVVVAIILYICIGLKQAQVFILGIAVGHAGQVVADRALQGASQRPPRVISQRGIDYVKKLPTAPAQKQAVDRLAFFQDYLNHSDNLIAEDAYDEFARACPEPKQYVGVTVRRGQENVATPMGSNTR